MRVFVWVSYGVSSVYSAETSEDISIIFNCIRDCMKDFYSPEDFIETFGSKPSIYDELAVMNLIDNFGGLNVYELFQSGTGFTNLIKR